MLLVVAMSVLNQTKSHPGSSRRAAYIRQSFSLRCEAGVWVARSAWGSSISSDDLAAVVSQARRRWGHFNFEDEARAFAEIFPAHLARTRSEAS
jgi:hypothetical protein